MKSTSIDFRPTHDELVERAIRWLVGTGGCGFAVPEITVGGVWESPDAIGWQSDGESILIECKTGRGDFTNDVKKPFRMHSNLGLGKYRYYLCRPNLILADDVPEDWGLLYCYPKVIKRVKSCSWRGFERYNKSGERRIQHALLRRAHLNGALNRCLSPKWAEKGNHFDPEGINPSDWGNQAAQRLSESP